MKYAYVISTLFFSAVLRTSTGSEIVTQPKVFMQSTASTYRAPDGSVVRTTVPDVEPAIPDYARYEGGTHLPGTRLVDTTYRAEDDSEGSPFFYKTKYAPLVPYETVYAGRPKHTTSQTKNKQDWETLTSIEGIPDVNYYSHNVIKAPSENLLQSGIRQTYNWAVDSISDSAKTLNTTKTKKNFADKIWDSLYWTYTDENETDMSDDAKFIGVMTKSIALPATYVPENKKNATTTQPTNNDQAKIDAKVLEQLQTTAPQPYKKTYTQQVKQPTFSKNMRVYTSDPNDPKTHGRKIRVEYPETWEPQPGISPNNLYKFNDKKYNSPGERRGRTCVINIVNVGENLSPYEWRYVLLEPDIKNGLLENKINILRSIFTQADANPALMIEAEHAYEQVGIKFYSKALYTIVGYKNTIITLVCMTIAGNENDARVLFDDSKPVFWQFMNSFKCLDKWEDHTNPDDDIWTEVEKEVFRVQTDVKQGNYDKLLNQLANNMETGSACLKDDAQTQRFKQSRDALWAYTVFHTDATITYWLPKYCAEYSVPYKFIRQFQKDIAPYKKDAQNQLKHIMGDEYASCMNYEFLQSNESAELAYFSLEMLRLQAGVTKQELCQALDMQSVLPSATNGLINTIKASK